MKNLKAKQKIDTFLEIQYIEIILKGGSKFGIGCYDGTHSLLPCNFVPLPKKKKNGFDFIKRWGKRAYNKLLYKIFGHFYI